MAIKWLPPESIRFQIYNKPTDVWSFGVLLWEVFSLGECPYSHLGNNEILRELDNGFRLEVPKEVEDDVEDVIYCCWHLEPELRPNFNDLAEFFATKISNDTLIYYKNIVK